MSNFPTIIINGGGLPGPQGPQGQSGSGTGDVISINGLTGVVTGAAFTGTVNNYTAVQTFSAGICASGVAFIDASNNFNLLQNFSSGISAAGATFGRLARFLQGLSASGGTFGGDIFVNGIDIGLGRQLNVANMRIGNGAMPLAFGGIATRNTAIGYQAMRGTTNAQDCTAIGYDSLKNATFVLNNVAVGSLTLLNNLTGSQNTAIGSTSLTSCINGSNNTAIGSSSLYGMKGDRNTAIGTNSGFYYSGKNLLESATGSIYIGYEATALADGAENEIVIGTLAVGNGSNTTTIGTAQTTSHYLNGIAQSTLNVVGDRVLVQNPRTISSRTETGTAGTICWDQNYLYVCVSTNAWAKVGLTW